VLLRQSPLTQWLGGQHGEEEKSEGSGEKGREEAPEEEVANRSFHGLRLRSMSMTASNGPAVVDLRRA
jgi:hypothetical protein